MHGSDKLLYYFLGILVCILNASSIDLSYYIVLRRSCLGTALNATQQLLLSSGGQSFIAGFPGILVGGLIASSKFLQLRLRIPKPISNTCRKYILPLIASNPPFRAQSVSDHLSILLHTKDFYTT